jgi:hypothetical protein
MRVVRIDMDGVQTRLDTGPPELLRLLLPEPGTPCNGDHPTVVHARRRHRIGDRPGGL